MSFTPVTRRGVTWLEADTIPVPHGFTTRLGGVSRGIWASMNLGTTRGDDPAAVDENYKLLCAAMGIRREALCFTHQVHGTAVLPVTAKDAHRLFTDFPYEADGLVTNEPGTPLICFAADCVPVLLCDPVARCVGAVHAGWKGTAADIVGSAVAVLGREYGARPENLRAAIGPHIGACCYETGAEVYAAMRDTLGDAADGFCLPRGEKYMTDLGGLNRALLLRAGLRAEHIALSEDCTACQHDLFWSHRYTKGQRGVQGAVIRLPKGETL